MNAAGGGIATLEYGLSLGSNLGDRLANLRAARRGVRALPQTDLAAQSPVYETDPVDVADAWQALSFLNAVLIVRSALAPRDLNRGLHRIEAELGRVRGGDRNAPRPVDIDIIYAGSERSASDDLRLPHPRWAERRFVVQPLADVRPELVLPLEARTVRGVLLALPATPAVVAFAREW
jgi:2-amino-4-hydroxy-6-hydroxymethyldihydropteridine diphosphokinase